MANTYTKIASVTVTSNTNNVTFNSIPQTYTDLKIVYSGRGDIAAAAYCDLWVNNNSTAGNYGSHFIAWNTAGTNGQTANAYTFTYGYFAAGDLTANTFGGGYFYIPSYTAGSILHNVYNYSATPKNSTSGAFGTINAGYAPTGAITRIDLNCGSSSTRYWVAGSEITLYGI